MNGPLARALNAETVDTTICVWPGCDRSLRYYRVGALCVDHAIAVRDAVESNESAVISNAQVRAVHRRTVEAANEARLAQSRGEQPGWIYYLSVGDRVKIGFSTNVRRRMRQYPPSSHLLAVHPGTPDLEVEMHRRFAGSRAAGREWFNRSTDLLEHIDQVVEQFGDPCEHRYHFRGSQPALRRPRS